MAASTTDPTEGAQLHIGEALCLEEMERVRITVAATTASTSCLVAAEREYVALSGMRCELIPTGLYARQLSRLGGSGRSEA